LNINGAGIQYSWLKKILRIDSYELMNEMSEEIPIGSDNLQVFPFGNGSERIFENKILDSNFKNINFNIHSPGHMCRATLEGIAFSFNYGIDILKNDGLEINVLKVGNDNLFKSKVFTKTLACLIDSPIERYNTTGAVGSARASSVDENSINDLSDKISNQDFVDSTISENRDLYLKAYINWKKNLEILIKNK
jgi:xylulokinase